MKLNTDVEVTFNLKDKVREINTVMPFPLLFCEKDCKLFPSYRMPTSYHQRLLASGGGTSDMATF
jgi:hypothetical protein